MSKLPQNFYTREDPVLIGRELLGKYLFTKTDNIITGGIIVETEAYNGRTDKACHAHLGRRTKRTEIMYRQGGVAYVYFTYGMHHLFNIVTNEEGYADAVLIRAIEPTEGIAEMMLRRGLNKQEYRLTAGPGVLCQALDISRDQYGEDLQGDKIWLEDRNLFIPDQDIITGPRIGIAYAKEDALLPWRFSIRNNHWVSRAKANYEFSNNSTK
ncbi:putative 3-methyladenine DNA glycosylase [Flammeovirgaceae bacterium 311]|nr:putative 3-methyladenine DNA glycosylase [Flammeovirgaceae bacterium 311]